MCSCLFNVWQVTFYNGNLGFFMVITFLFEFSRGGVVYPNAKMSVVNQEMYKTGVVLLGTER